jgi:hypothetical protein
MGLGRWLLLGDLDQQIVLEELRQSLATLRADGTLRDPFQDQRLLQLQAENDALQLCVAMLIRMLQSQSLLSAEQVDTLAKAIEPAITTSPVEEEALRAAFRRATS